MTQAQIKHIIRQGENIHAEFKKSRSKLPKDLFETICAFLNTDGGIILLGVSDDGEIIGIEPERVEQMKKDIANLSNNPQKLQPGYFLKIRDLEIDGKKIIVIEVPVSAQVHKTNGKIFVRNQDGDFIVEHPVEIARIVNRKQNYYSEQIIFPQVKLNELNPVLIDRTKKLIRLNRPDNHLWQLDDMDFLLKTGLYRKDENGKSGFTLAAVLFFGTDELIQSLLPAYKFEALLRIENIDRYDDRLTIRTNLLDAYDQLMAFINKHLKDPFYLEGTQRISLRSKIFRELVANIIAHREYLNPAPATITILPDKIQFKNPNNPKVFGKIDPEHFSPFAKNPLISKLMLQMGLVEEVGSGIYNVKKYLPLYDPNATYEFIDDEFFITTIHIEAIGGAIGGAISGSIGDSMGGPINDLTDRQKEILELIIENNKISYRAIAQKVGINASAVLKHLNTLKEKGIIARVGGTRGYWKILEPKK